MFEGWAQTSPLRNIRQLDSRRSISIASTQRTGNTFTEWAEGDKEILWDEGKDKWLQVKEWNGSSWPRVKAEETEWAHYHYHVTLTLDWYTHTSTHIVWILFKQNRAAMVLFDLHHLLHSRFTVIGSFIRCLATSWLLIYSHLVTSNQQQTKAGSIPHYAVFTIFLLTLQADMFPATAASMTTNHPYLNFSHTCTRQTGFFYLI